jgi:NADH:ubiquinone oxidoreductase subunit 5 (subunit L)/multisubunit Na+/H+ antiporter MnhA subunit
MFLLVSYFSSLSLYFFFKKYTTPKYYALANFLILSALILGLSGLAAAVFFSNQAFYFTTENLLGTLMILDCSLSFSLNSLSYSFSLLVLIIGAATNLYILNYFKNEADEGTFIF